MHIKNAQFQFCLIPAYLIIKIRQNLTKCNTMLHTMFSNRNTIGKPVSNIKLISNDQLVSRQDKPNLTVELVVHPHY